MHLYIAILKGMVTRNEIETGETRAANYPSDAEIMIKNVQIAPPVLPIPLKINNGSAKLKMKRPQMAYSTEKPLYLGTYF